MSSIIGRAYFNFRKRKLCRARKKLKGIGIDVITKIITKDCWNYSIQYEIILKTSDLLIIKLTGREKAILLKYHRKKKVMLQEYDSFLAYLNLYNIEKGIYITTGIFEERIYKHLEKNRNIKISNINGYKFAGKYTSTNNLNFIRYFPK